MCIHMHIGIQMHICIPIYATYIPHTFVYVYILHTYAHLYTCAWTSSTTPRHQPAFFFLEKQSVCLVFINHPCPKMGAQSYR